MLTTPLTKQYTSDGVKLVPFAGWEMPIQFTGLSKEHVAVRTEAGLFDVSHMGEMYVSGEGAHDFLNYVTCNDVAKLENSDIQYSAVLNDLGGVIDDVLVYKHTDQKYMVCANASNKEAVYNWFKQHAPKNIELEDISTNVGLLALQGPASIAMLEGLPAFKKATTLDRFQLTKCDWDGVEVVVSRTGYTGEDGFELMVPWDKTADLYNLLLAQNEGCLECGLGARDSLRLEVGYPLHGHELALDKSALQSGLGWIIKFKKGDFIGKEALLAEKESGIPNKLVGLEVLDKGIVREDIFVFNDANEEIGLVTSGTRTPFLKKSIAMARIHANEAIINNKVFAEVRGKKLACKVVSMPFYKSGI